MIGIITFVGTQSHGACLQAYALKKKITDMGYEAAIIPYQCAELKKEMDKRLPSAKGSLKKRAGAMVRYPVIRERYRKFAAFERDYLGVGALSPSVDFSRYDRIIAGSDQIWNLEITGGDRTYFLKGIAPEKKATYAASLGTDAFSKDVEEECIALIDEIPFINVREKNLQEYLQKKLPERRIGLVLDPTQLVSAEDWKALAGDTPARKNKYMLVHYPAEIAGTWETIHAIAKERDLEVVFLTNKIKPRKDCECIYAADPLEYLNLVRYADYVVTGSFHTLSFSLLFEREFLCTKAMIESRNSRLASLLELSGCTDRTVSVRFDGAPIDYGRVNERLREEREYSAALLREACEGVPCGEIPEPEHREKDRMVPKAEPKGVPLLYAVKEDCSGCTACMNVCPVNAISMKADNEGFLYPSIDEEKCVHCRKCVSVCPFKKDQEHDLSQEKEMLPSVQVYAGRLSDREQLLKSSSGGAFTAISDLFIRNGDAVVCSTYDYEENKAYYALFTDEASRDAARGSKYVQSSPGDVFREAEKWLRKNPDRKLLFVGAGCQAAGFIHYARTKKLSDRVTAVDIICHGGMSPGLWNDYTAMIEARHGKIINVTFKDKRNGWKAPTAVASVDGGEVSLKDYVHIFYSKMALRPSCHKCPYAAVDRYTDITIGDYWGIEKALPEFYSEDGVSLILVHTKKGQEIFDRASQAMDHRASNVKDCLQPNLESPTPVSEKRWEFWRDYTERGIAYTMEAYGKDPLLRRMKRKAVRILRSAKPGSK